MRAGLIYLASGFGKRYGKNKLLECFRGKPLYQYGLEALLETAGALRQKEWRVRVTAVSQYREILESAKRLGAQAVKNETSGEGITSSIHLGVLDQPEQTELYLFCVADQPGLRSATLISFLTGFAVCEKNMGCLCRAGIWSNPAVFRGEYREKLLALTGDRGGSVLLRREPDQVWLWETEPDELEDVDRPEDMEKILKRSGYAEHGCLRQKGIGITK